MLLSLHVEPAVSQSGPSHLQLVQKAAARLLTGSRKKDPITSVFPSFYWLPMKHAVNFKIHFCVFKTLHGLVSVVLFSQHSLTVKAQWQLSILSFCSQTVKQFSPHCKVFLIYHHYLNLQLLLCNCISASLIINTVLWFPLM